MRNAPDEGIATEIRAMAERTLIGDVLCLRGADQQGAGVFVGQPTVARARSIPPRQRTALTCAAVHIEAARRLRDALAPTVDAVVSPRGSLLHAERGAESKRTSIVAAARARAAARSRRLPEADAVEIWQALVEGEWSLVDHVDTDGKRLVLARRNPSFVRDPKALSAQERVVVRLAGAGRANKLIAYELGLAISTVATHLASAMRKLRVRSRRELVTLFSECR